MNFILKYFTIPLPPWSDVTSRFGTNKNVYYNYTTILVGPIHLAIWRLHHGLLARHVSLCQDLHEDGNITAHLSTKVKSLDKASCPR